MFKLIILLIFLQTTWAILTLKPCPQRSYWAVGEGFNTFRLYNDISTVNLNIEDCLLFKNGIQVKDFKSSNIRRKKTSRRTTCVTPVTGCFFYFVNVTESDSGKYSCKYRGENSNEVEINVGNCNSFTHPKLIIDYNQSDDSVSVELKDKKEKFHDKEKLCFKFQLSSANVTDITEIPEMEYGKVSKFNSSTHRVSVGFCDCPNPESADESAVFKAMAEFNTGDIKVKCTTDQSKKLVLSVYSDFEKLNSIDSSINLDLSNYTIKKEYKLRMGNTEVYADEFITYFKSYKATVEYIHSPESYYYKYRTKTKTVSCPDYIDQQFSLKLNNKDQHLASFTMYADDHIIQTDSYLFTQSTLKNKDLGYFYTIKDTLLFSDLNSSTSYEVFTKLCYRENNVTISCYDENQAEYKFVTEAMQVKGAPLYTIIYSSVGFVVILAVVLLIVRKIKQSRGKPQHPEVFYNLVPRDGNSMNPNSYYTPMVNQSKSAAFMVSEVRDKLQRHVVDESYIEVGKEIGQGQFGSVYQGFLTHNKDTGEKLEEKVKVAIKFAKSDEMTLEEKLEFLTEARRMEDLNHSNVMKLFGIYMPEFKNVKNFKPGVILPFMKYGDLKTYLSNKRITGSCQDMTLQDILHYTLNVARGMSYLMKRGVVHRDLAARNCMLDERKNVVIADFGLAKSLYSKNYYRQTKAASLPVKWLAIESLSDGIFTTKSDVWSYGVTVWEFLSMGQQPYPGISNSEMKDHIYQGKRLEKPVACPKNIWAVIIYPSWSVIPENRMNFTDIVDQLEVEIAELDEETLMTPMKVVRPVNPGNLYEQVQGCHQGDEYILADDDKCFENEGSSAVYEL